VHAGNTFQHQTGALAAPLCIIGAWRDPGLVCCR
jgi:hypothetical protein